MDNGAKYCDFSEDLTEKLRQSQSVLKEAFHRYQKHQIFLSFNGGKDCTVLLHLMCDLFKDFIDELKVIYLQSADPFEELESFVKFCEIHFRVKIVTITSSSSMKEILADICENDKDIAACIMGSRRTDPYCEHLKNFQPTDRGWPELMRINPMLEWNCANVWEYLVKLKVPYCSLYDRGFTSIGNKKNTQPNPNLENKDKPGTFLPAYELLDDSLERAGREIIVEERVTTVSVMTFATTFEASNVFELSRLKRRSCKMPDHLGDDMRKVKVEEKKEEEPEIKDLDEGDIELLKTYGQGQYHKSIKQIEDDIQKAIKQVNELTGIKESDTGLAPPALWDLAADKQTLQNEQPLQVARCTKIINADTDDPKYIINVKQFAKFVVDLADSVAPTDIEEGMRVGVDRNKYQIHIPLPPKIDPTVTMMQVEDKPDVTYSDVGGCKEQIEKLREVVETPLLHPEKFVTLGIEPPKGVLLFGPPGTGKTLCARAVANRTDACFIRVIGSELVQKYVGEGARMVRELFEMARSKKACLIFFDEIDAIGGARFDDGAGGDNEVQRTMLELINQLDGFDPRGNIKVLMATNRPDTLDPALMRPGRLDRKVEFGLPDLEGRTHIFKIHARSMSVERDIRFELLARLCPNSTGAEIRSVCTEAGMFAIRARRKVATEKDFLEAVNKVIKSYAKFSATPRYMTYN
ncbi:CLUMA_CG010984, isoform A [Clunio marinus]|uniref:26S proteasome regulatory subunit 7 n=2 Tax=Bilateria TaxID=33213 RepID=A0A1J1IF22_9DIPT|nr:CLUMA_CG010984, isoform A [Clunio marinus]